MLSDKKVASEVDEGKHSVTWLAKKDVAPIITHKPHQIVRDAFCNGPIAYTEKGLLVNSDTYTGMTSDEAIPVMQTRLTKQGIGGVKVQYRLQDWVFSRQRYWGEPIPMIHGKDGKIIPMSEKDLPLELPMVEEYEPTGSEEGPLANITEWVTIPE